MKNLNPKIVEIVSEQEPIFKCKKCGQTWLPDIKPASEGKIWPSAWKCPNECGEAKE